MSDSEVILFRHEQFGEIRTLNIDGEPWFVGKDIALSLGYTNPAKALRDHVDSDDVTVNDSFTVNGTQGKLINESGIRNSWVLYAEYADKNYTQSKTYQIGEDKSVMHTCWTQAGRLFLYQFLKERGIFPMCEQEE